MLKSPTAERDPDGTGSGLSGDRSARRDPTRVGILLRYYRIRTGWSQARLARSVGVSLGVVRGLEQGTAALHPAHLAKLSAWLLDRPSEDPLPRVSRLWGGGPARREDRP